MGAPGKFGFAETALPGVAVVTVARETAKMRPSENYALVWRAPPPRRYRSRHRTGSGAGGRSGDVSGVAGELNSPFVVRAPRSDQVRRAP
ncbi:hypothetical protein GCM10023215_53050 [Pseudonocardia yuanmonensis]|uniref:Uncharacterized protein n=1 Tax=Pseudonocardia yuanmonensis TaxID=1095914 RepID=A0ABP8XHF3_9PSEU